MTSFFARGLSFDGSFNNRIISHRRCMLDILLSARKPVGLGQKGRRHPHSMRPSW